MFELLRKHQRAHVHIHTVQRSGKRYTCSAHCNNFPQLSDPNLSDTIIRFSGNIAQHERVNGEEGDVDEQLQSGRPLLQLYAPGNMLLYPDKSQQTASLAAPL